MPSKKKKKKKKAMSWEDIGEAICRKIESEDWEGKMDKISRTKCHVRCRGPESAVYGLGFIGALVYYLTTAPTLWAAVAGFFKAIVWPAFMVYGALKYLGL